MGRPRRAGGQDMQTRMRFERRLIRRWAYVSLRRLYCPYTFCERGLYRSGRFITALSSYLVPKVRAEARMPSLCKGTVGCCAQSLSYLVHCQMMMIYSDCDGLMIDYNPWLIRFQRWHYQMTADSKNARHTDTTRTSFTDGLTCRVLIGKKLTSPPT